VLLDSQAVGTILDDEPIVWIGRIEQAEGNTGTTTFNFPVHLSHAYDQPVMVHYTTADGQTDYWYAGATAGTDYVATAGDLTFAPGETEKIIPVTVIGDRIPEGNTQQGLYESFSLYTKATSANVRIGGGAFGVILDDEPRVSVDYAGEVTEGDSGTTALLFPVQLSVAYDVPVTVTYSPVQDTNWLLDKAQPGSDYVAGTLSFTFAPGQTAGFLPVQVVGDRLHEPAREVLDVHLLSTTFGALGRADATGWIRDNDPAPALRVSDVSVREGSHGTTAFVFTLTLSGPSGMSAWVNYATADGTATLADSDYLAASGSVWIPTGATTATVTVWVTADRKKEGNETFFLNLSGATDAVIADGLGVGTIMNDD
jgi:hypothetical protein